MPRVRESGVIDDLAGTVLITVDSLRADALTGPSASVHAPTLSALADRGTAYENTFAHGNWTPFSFPSIMASRPVFDTAPSLGLPDSPTLAETLSEAGIKTGGFNAANGFLTDHWGYNRGFDSFEACLPDGDGPINRYLSAHPTMQGWADLATRSARRAATRIGESLPGFDSATESVPAGKTGGPLDLDPGTEDARARALADRARTFLGRVDGRFFLWIHFMDAHTPYLPAPRHVAAVTGDRIGVLRGLRAHARTGLGLEVTDATLMRLRQLYRASIHEIDTAVRGVLDALDAQDLRDRTCVVFASDHGEEFMDHGHLAHYPKLYEELIHVPLVIDHPEGSDRNVATPVGLDSLAPTVCAAMGVSPPAAFEGESLLSSTLSNDSPTGEPVVSLAVRGESITRQPIPRSLGEGDPIVSARTREWTYIYHPASGERELYDRLADPAELDDRSAAPDDPEIVPALHEAVTTHLARLATDTRDRTAPSSPGLNDSDGTPADVETRLQALGYR
jgi:arylsulfatase A-like enzyme